MKQMSKVTNEDLKKEITKISRNLNVLAQELGMIPGVRFFKDKKSGKVDYKRRKHIETLEDYYRDFEDLKDI